MKVLDRIAAKVTCDALSKLEHNWLKGPVSQELIEMEDTITDAKFTTNHIVVMIHARNPFR